MAVDKISSETNRQHITITSTSEYILHIAGELVGDVLFVDVVISNTFPATGFVNIPISLPSSALGRGIVYPLNDNSGGIVAMPSGNFSFGSVTDNGKVGSARISNSSITVMISEAVNANFFVSFVVYYPKV